MGVHEHNRETIVAGLMIAVFGTGFLLDSLGYWRLNLVYVWPVLLIGFGVSVLLGRNVRLVVEKKRSSDLAIAEERVKIAQELHDIVAHSVSLMTVQIAAARRVLTQKPDESARALEAAEDTGRKSLDELRRIVGVLRSADASIEAASFRPETAQGPSDSTRPLPGLSQIEPLVEEMRSAGLDLTLEVKGQPGDASDASQLASYRVVQESLTNVMRHAPKARVRVEIDYSNEDAIDISIEDDGAGFVLPTRKPTFGHGLVGMRERVSAVGGKIEAGPLTDSGWFVKAHIPARRQ